MSSPLGHAYAGVAAAWAADLVPGPQGSRDFRLTSAAASFFRRAGGTLTLICAGLAILPDLDLALQAHRSASHSVTAVVIITILSGAVTAWVTRRPEAEGASHNPVAGVAGVAPAGRVARVARVAMMCGAAYGTHLLVDWLAVDLTPPYGIQLFWPFSANFYLSGVNLFPRTERREFAWWAIRINLITMAWETAIFAPILALLWVIREKALARLAAQVSSRHHPPQ